MKKKTTYYQAVCYTTDHCDDDLIAPSFWNPTKDRKEAASEIMTEIEQTFACMTKFGPESITIEFRHNTDDNISWDSKVIKNWNRNKKFLTMLEQGLADGSIITVMVTVPEYVNLCNVLINERKDVFHINSFTI
jgi:hypothetical protein